MRRMTETEWRAFLMEGPHTGKLATVRPDGRPHIAPVWFTLDGSDLVFTTWAETVKGRNLVNDPRVCLCVDDEKPPFSYVVVEGEARTSTDPGELRHWATVIGERYMGADEAAVFGGRNAVPGELLVRVHVHHVVAEAAIAE